MEKKLYKSTKDKKIFGVCGGIAEYFEKDSTLIRVLAIVLAFMGVGILAYIICAIIMSNKPSDAQ